MAVLQQLGKLLFQLPGPVRLSQHRDQGRKLQDRLPGRHGRASRGGEEAAVDRDGYSQKQETGPERCQLRPQAGQILRRHQGTEHIDHGIGKISLGIELRALGKDQDKRHQEIQQDTGKQAPVAEIGDHHQAASHKEQTDIADQRIIALLVADLEKDGHHGDHQQVVKAKELVHDRK